MARLFDDASNEYLEHASAVLTGPPVTFACWGKTDTLAAERCAVGIFYSGVDADWFSLENAAGTLRAWHRVAGTLDGRADAAAGMTANVWEHYCGVFATATSRACYLNGGNKGTNSDDQTFSVTIDETTIGRRSDFSPGQYWSGSIAEVAIWSAALTDAEVAVLATGISPRAIRPASLVFYAPLWRDEDEDFVGGLSLTAFETPSIGAHPLVFYLSPAQIGKTAAAAGETLNISVIPELAAYTVNAPMVVG